MAAPAESYAGYSCHTKYALFVFDRAATSTSAVAEAKRICAGCPVRLRCRSDAIVAEGTLSVQYRTGIRGGLTPEERHKRAQKRTARRTVDVTTTKKLVADLSQRGFTLGWISREIGRSQLQLPKSRIDTKIAEAIADLAQQISSDLVMPAVPRGRRRPTLTELLATLPEAA